MYSTLFSINKLFLAYKLYFDSLLRSTVVGVGRREGHRVSGCVVLNFQLALNRDVCLMKDRNTVK